MFRCEADTKDGGVCLHTLRNGECPNWANHAPNTSWSIDSALWQIIHGERNSDKTNNASEYLHEMVDSPNSGIVDETEKEFARNLMGAISDLRDKIGELEETDTPVDYGAPCPHYDSQGNRISCTQAEHIDAARTVIANQRQNRTTHTLWYVAIQVQTFKSMHTGSKQVPGFWVEAVSEGEARRKAADIINTLAGYSHGEISSCDPQRVTATLIWAEQEN